MASIFSDRFLLFNEISNKKISVVVTIDGVPDKLSNRPIYEKIKYGDPDLFYGGPIVYGGLRIIDGVRDILSLEGSSLTVSQRLEPEQGRGAISTFTLAFIDKDVYMTQLISPGFIVDEILGKNVQIELGYEEVSYPQDYFTIFRGFISQAEPQSGRVIIQISDPNLKRRQNIFFTAKTKLTSAITNVATTIPVAAASDFHQQILGPDGLYDPAIKTYIKIENEYIEYPATGISGNNFVTVLRGQRGTTAAAHPINADVFAALHIQDHCMDMALKIMLSGWVGYWKIEVPVASLADTTVFELGIIPEAIIFTEDVVANYGLVAGDYITISGATIPANNKTIRIVDFRDRTDEQPNYIVIADSTFVAEAPTTGAAAFRSQYDTYPRNASIKLTPREVDVDAHIELKDTFLGDIENSYRFFILRSESGKGFIETEIYLPVSCYSTTRRGRVSVNITKAPIANAELVFLDVDNVLSPQAIRISRGVNVRKFFNEITFDYDLSDDGQTYGSQFRALDVDSLSLIGISSVLPLKSRGLRSDLSIDATTMLERRALFLLSRYKLAASEISLKVNWGSGIKIEVGDVVALDGNDLFISNIENGTRDFGVQLLEVTERNLDLAQGNVSLKLISGLGASVTDRFATISPSSELNVGSTTVLLIIRESFSAADPVFPGAEYNKWMDYEGEEIVVHNETYSFSETTTIVSFDQVNPHKITIDPPLSISPPAGYIVDIPKYSTSEESTVQSAYKSIHAHVNPTVLVLAGIDDKNFTVAVLDQDKFNVGAAVRIHNADFTIDSLDAFVDTIVGNQITVVDSLGFTPATGQFIELIGYADEGGAYRFI